VPSADQRVDLHIHTTASDGAHAPAAVVHMAAEAGLAAIAITDHDTVSGLADAREAAQSEKIELLNGVEVSAEFPGGTMHILGYGFDPDNVPLREMLQQFQRNRAERNPRILTCLARMGMPLSYQTVRAKAGGETVGRPHIAQAMIDAGYVHTADEAFSRYLGRGCPAYVERRRAAPQEAIRVIREAGGLAVLAHPTQLRRPMSEVRRVTAELAGLGLEGIETYHPDHSADDARTFEVLARELGLIMTGGSDYHGHIRHGVQVGSGRGQLRVTYEAVRQIHERLAGRTPSR
jgi:hypothetical protein